MSGPQQGIFWPQVNSGKVNYSHNLATHSPEIFLDRAWFSIQRNEEIGTSGD